MVVFVQHLQIDDGIFVSPKSDEARISCLLGFQRGFQASPFKNPVGIIVVVNFMELPKVQVVSPKATQAIL